ncbi:hypothetical protein D3874_08250 [Oleomonas cavernae]|uniref:Uncharacterized protein n=1 Tax=Oleomonas cavernae TaxID=2320859 RepID=A0A418WAD7_9PROT|nr:DUF6516 family protein [Oleomonas cavernae]RJF87011.1 hypothetical protein D3874_08250 [Oleomonas cavernae]
MKAVLLYKRRHVLAENAFAELVLWRLPAPVPPSPHGLKYRLAYVVDGVCVLRYDNERGKGDHRHFGDVESAYAFSDPETLLADFWADVARWNDENRGS